MRRIRNTTASAIILLSAATSSAASPPAALVSQSPQERESLPLGPSSASTAQPDSDATLNQQAPAASIGFSKTLGALIVVVGLAYISALLWKKAARSRGTLIAALGPAGRSPSGIVEVLARYPVSRSQRLVLLRVGPRVLLLCQSSGLKAAGAGLATLTEFTNPDEIASILHSVRQTTGTSNEAAFRETLREVDQSMPTQPDHAVLRSTTPDGDTIEWRDERIVIPTQRPATPDLTDPAIGRLRDRLAAMRSNGAAS